MSDKPQPNWDLDYAAGRQAELWVSDIRKALEEDSIEVKLDRRFCDTGNIYVEFECKGKPSGIAKTKSKVWVQVLVQDELAIVISTERLKELARKFYKDFRRSETDGSHPTRGVAIPVEEIIRGAIKRRTRTA